MLPSKSYLKKKKKNGAQRKAVAKSRKGTSGTKSRQSLVSGTQVASRRNASFTQLLAEILKVKASWGGSLNQTEGRQSVVASQGGAPFQVWL